MDLAFNKKSEVKISIVNFLKETSAKFPAEIKGPSTSPPAIYLFDVIADNVNVGRIF